MAKKWIKVESKPTWKFQEDKEVEGVYVSKDEAVGLNNSSLYNLKQADGSIIGVWSNTLLDDKLKGVEFGQEVKIVYLGKVVSEKTGREYNNFDVYVGDPEEKSSKESDMGF